MANDINKYPNEILAKVCTKWRQIDLKIVKLAAEGSTSPLRHPLSAQARTAVLTRWLPHQNKISPAFTVYEQDVTSVFYMFSYFRLQETVQQYVEDPDTDSTLNVGADMRKINECFRIFKVSVCSWLYRDAEYFICIMCCEKKKMKL